MHSKLINIRWISLSETFIASYYRHFSMIVSPLASSQGEFHPKKIFGETIPSPTSNSLKSKLDQYSSLLIIYEDQSGYLRDLTGHTHKIINSIYWSMFLIETLDMHITILPRETFLILKYNGFIITWILHQIIMYSRKVNLVAD